MCVFGAGGLSKYSPVVFQGNLSPLDICAIFLQGAEANFPLLVFKAICHHWTYFLYFLQGAEANGSFKLPEKTRL